MIDIHVGARVECSDGAGGTVTNVIVDRATRRITHLVVKEGGFAGLERLVPVERAAEGDGATIRLHCTRAELGAMESFTVPEMIENAQGQMEPAAMYWMKSMPGEANWVPIEVEQVPAGGVAVRRGMPVEATDGGIGHLDDLLVDPSTNQITHFSVSEGHLHQRELTLPISAVDRVSAGAIYLKLTRSAVAALPVVPARRLFGKGATRRAVPTEMALFAFPMSDAAGRALQQIQALAGGVGQPITASVILVKGADGTVRTSKSAGVNSRSAPLLRALADELCGRATSSLMAEFGPTDEQVQAMRSAIAPGGSALLAVIDAQIWTGAVEEVARFGGTVVRHALLDAIVRRLAGEAEQSNAQG